MTPAYGDQEVECGSWNENGSHKFIYLNAWYPAGRTVCEGLGLVALLEEAPLGMGTEVSKPSHSQFASSQPPTRGSGVNFQLLFQHRVFLLEALLPTTMIMGIAFGSVTLQ